MDKHIHARKRRVLSHAFSDHAIKSMEKYVLGNVRTFCESIGQKNIVRTQDLTQKELPEKGWSTPQNMSDWCNW
jgi:hypothetical protein